MTILYFILGLGLLIFIHELGHFLVAKWNGIRVERFSLGFGPRIFKFQWGETEYCLSILPLGGYVKMTGQEDFGEEEEISPLDDPKAFNSKSLKARLSVVFAGPVMNLILPVILLPIVFMIGRNVPKYLSQTPELVSVVENSPAQKAGLEKGDIILSVQDQKVQNWEQALQAFDQAQTQWQQWSHQQKVNLWSDWFVFFPALLEKSKVNLEIQRGEEKLQKSVYLAKVQNPLDEGLGLEPSNFVQLKPIVGDTGIGSSAEAAGVRTGDIIVAVNGQTVQSWKEVTNLVRDSEGKPLIFTLQRADKMMDVSLKPKLSPDLQRYQVGIEVSESANAELYQRLNYPFSQAVQKGLQQHWGMMKTTCKVLSDLFTLKLSVKDLSGFVGIAQVSGKAAKKGIANFLFLLSFLSVQLGILNLLPIPVLDGGHILFMLYEAIRGKAMAPKKRFLAQQVGMVMLLTLMVLVTINDLMRLNLVEKIKGLF